VYTKRNKLWDIAAGALLAMEAGAALRAVDGSAYFPMDLGAYRNDELPFIAAGPAVLEALLADYREAL
jgi:fructose-1,6-bisphosphatase/inositol monophosphatase family enzyme